MVVELDHGPTPGWGAFGTDVRFGSKADICAATSHVRFTPNSDRESEIPQKAMSALARKRTCAVQLAFDRNPKRHQRPPSKRPCEAATGGKLSHEMSHWRGSNRQVMMGTAMT
jgi:hypothetical protein